MYLPICIWIRRCVCVAVEWVQAIFDVADCQIFSFFFLHSQALCIYDLCDHVMVALSPISPPTTFDTWLQLPQSTLLRMVHEIRPEFASIRSRQGRFGGVEIGADRLMGSRWHCNSFEIKQNSTQSKENPTTFVAYLAVKWKYIMCCRRLLCTLHTYTHSSDLFPFKLKSNLWVRSFLGSCVHIVSI